MSNTTKLLDPNFYPKETNEDNMLKKNTGTGIDVILNLI